MWSVIDTIQRENNERAAYVAEELRKLATELRPSQTTYTQQRLRHLATLLEEIR